MTSYADVRHKPEENIWKVNQSVLFKVFISLIYGIFFFSARSSLGIEQSFRAWNRVSVMTHPSPVGFYFQVQPQHQWIEVRQVLTQFDLTSAIIFDLHHGYTAWLGAAWVPTLDPQYINEWRVGQALQLVQLIADQRLQLEYRLTCEQRWISNAPSVAYRLIGRFYWKEVFHLKINQRGSWGVASYLDLFMNLNQVPNAVPIGYGQSDFFIGPLWQATDQLYVQVGYLNEVSRGTNNLQMFHVLFSQLNFRL